MYPPLPSKVFRIAERMKLSKLDPLYRGLDDFSAIIDNFWNTSWAERCPEEPEIGGVAEAYHTIICHHGSELLRSVADRHDIASSIIMEEITWLCAHYQDAVNSSLYLWNIAHCQTTIGDFHTFAWSCSRTIPWSQGSEVHKAGALKAYISAYIIVQAYCGPLDPVRIATIHSFAAFERDVRGEKAKAVRMLSDVIGRTDRLRTSTGELKITSRQSEPLPIEVQVILEELRRAREAWERDEWVAAIQQPHWNYTTKASPLLRMVHLLSTSYSNPPYS